MHPKIELEKLINERMADLRSYAQKENANNSYIERQNSENSSLFEISKNIPEFSFFWSEVEKALNQAQNINPKTGLNLVLSFGGRMGDFIYINKEILL